MAAAAAAIASAAPAAAVTPLPPTLLFFPSPTTQVVEAVADELQTRGLVRLVVDPVLVSTSGDALATAGKRFY